jgi:hypothetical protein
MVGLMLDATQPDPWARVECRYCGAPEIVRNRGSIATRWPFVCMECGAKLAADEVGYDPYTGEAVSTLPDS